MNSIVMGFAYAIKDNRAGYVNPDNYHQETGHCYY